MGHDGGVFDETFHSSKTFGEGKDVHVLQESTAFCNATLEEDGDHSAACGGAVQTHLSRRKSVLRMTRETWIDNARNFRMRLKPRSDTCRAGAVLTHAHRERLNAAQREVRIERSHDTANGILHKAQLLSKRFIADNQRAANRVAVAAEILGGGMHHHIDAQFERPLQQWSCKGVIANRDGSACLANLRNGCQVHEFQSRVGWRFYPNHLGLMCFHCCLKFGNVGHVNKLNLQALTSLAHLVQQAIGAAIHIIHAQDGVTGVKHFQRSTDGCKATCKAEAAIGAVFFFSELGTFNIGNQPLGRKARGIVAAAVFVPLVNAGAFLNKGAACENRGHHCASSRLG